MTKKEIVKALNEDIKGEHAAIIQYLIYAYKMGEGEIACEIEAIAREEMRHFDWLAETIVSLGGKPSIERGKMRLGNRSVANWMRNDVTAEEEAITYIKNISKLSPSPRLKDYCNAFYQTKKPIILNLPIS